VGILWERYDNKRSAPAYLIIDILDALVTVRSPVRIAHQDLLRNDCELRRVAHLAAHSVRTREDVLEGAGLCGVGGAEGDEEMEERRCR
jgi:hypothetical protein